MELVNHYEVKGAKWGGFAYHDKSALYGSK
jgi:hypothetical protein